MLRFMWAFLCIFVLDNSFSYPNDLHVSILVLKAGYMEMLPGLLLSCATSHNSKHSDPSQVTMFWSHG